MAKIYVASSWRNQDQPAFVQFLRDHGHDVYDFRNPSEGDNGFHWSGIDPKWQEWSRSEYRDCLNHPIAESSFMKYFDAMKWADVFIGIQPFGRSASIEMGWAAGQGKKTILLLASGEPELMVKVFDHICCDPVEVLDVLDAQQQLGADEDHAAQA